MPNLEKARTEYNAACEECASAFYACYGGSAAWALKSVLGALHIPTEIKESEAKKMAENKKIPEGLSALTTDSKAVLQGKIDKMKTQLESAIAEASSLNSTKKKDVLAHLTAAQKHNNAAIGHMK